MPAHIEFSVAEKYEGGNRGYTLAVSMELYMYEDTFAVYAGAFGAGYKTKKDRKIIENTGRPEPCKLQVCCMENISET